MTASIIISWVGLQKRAKTYKCTDINHITEKFGGQSWNHQIKSTNIISHAKHNDVMHAVALFGPIWHPSTWAVHVHLGASTLPVLFFVNLWTCGFVTSTSWSNKRQQHSLIKYLGHHRQIEIPPISFYTCFFSGQTAKLNRPPIFPVIQYIHNTLGTRLECLHSRTPEEPGQEQGGVKYTERPYNKCSTWFWSAVLSGKNESVQWTMLNGSCQEVNQ